MLNTPLVGLNFEIFIFVQANMTHVYRWQFARLLRSTKVYTLAMLVNEQLQCKRSLPRFEEFEDFDSKTVC